MTRRHLSPQIGMTLIELMIALTIASILMFGVGTVYVSSKRGYNIQDNLARQQENSRFSLDVLMRDLRMAGYPKTFIKDPIMTAATQTADGGGSVDDTITVQYESATDCLGQPTPANSCVDDTTKQCAINKYYIATDAATNRKNLYCLGNGGANPDIIAEGITNLQFQYGVDTDASGAANAYFTWNNISVAERPNIVSVRFALLSQTLNDVKKAATNNVSYTLLDQTYTPSDKRFHHVYSNTVLLRNRLQ